MSDSVGIVVLAAGASERMGEPKQLLRFGGESLLRRAARTALGTRARPVVVVLGSSVAETRLEVEDLDVRIAVNSDWAEGMGSSIRCGLAEFEEATLGKTAGLVLMLCDQPFVTSALLDRLIVTHQSKRSLLVASTYESKGKRVRGVPALFDRALYGELASLEGAEGARRVVERHSDDAEFVEAPEAALDVDTREDYDALSSG